MSEKMIFCLGDGKYESKGEGYQKNHRIFNQYISEEEYTDILKLIRDNEIKIQLTEWTDYKELTKDEQTSTAKQIGGLLKTFSYEEAWDNFWKEATQTQKNCIINLKWFDTNIFKEITGINVIKPEKMITLSNGKKVSESTVIEALKAITEG